MIRLPATGISISQVDLNQHFSQLDIYQGLRRQGFKREQIVRYLEQQRNNEQQQRKTSLLSEPSCAPSTLDLYTQTHSVIEHDSPKILEFATLPAEERTPTSQYSGGLEVHKNNTKLDSFESENTQSPATFPEAGQHVPRQSSLLRFAEVLSTESSLGRHTTDKTAISPRTIKYRSRSLTYSYDQSVPDDDDEIHIDSSEATVIDKLEHIAIDDEIVEECASSRPAIPMSSTLSAEAEPFVPSRSSFPSADKGKRRASTPQSSRDSSSSPVLRTVRRVSTPELPSLCDSRLPSAPPRTLSQQHSDGLLRVYDDFCPAHAQPQTPAEIDRTVWFNEYNTAYTAPPGKLRSPVRYGRQSNHDDRWPLLRERTASQRAHVMHSRRQRQPHMIARTDGLIRDRETETVNASRNGLDGTREESNLQERAARLWRGDFDTQDAGGENEDVDVDSTVWAGRIRAVSGNTRTL